MDNNMSFDSSRFTFNPWNDFLGVVMQQGRVQLDSSLLHDDAEKIIPRIKGEAAAIKAHVVVHSARGHSSNAQMKSDRVAVQRARRPAEVVNDFVFAFAVTRPFRVQVS